MLTTLEAPVVTSVLNPTNSDMTNPTESLKKRKFMVVPYDAGLKATFAKFDPLMRIINDPAFEL